MYFLFTFRNGRRVTKIETTTTDSQGNKTVETKTEEEDVGTKGNGNKKQIGRSYDPFDNFGDDDDFDSFGFFSSSGNSKKTGQKKQLK